MTLNYVACISSMYNKELDAKLASNAPFLGTCLQIYRKVRNNTQVSDPVVKIFMTSKSCLGEVIYFLKVKRLEYSLIQGLQFQW